MEKSTALSIRIRTEARWMNEVVCGTCLYGCHICANSAEFESVRVERPSSGWSLHRQTYCLSNAHNAYRIIIIIVIIETSQMRQPVAMEIVSFCEGNIVTGKWYCHRNFKPSFRSKPPAANRQPPRFRWILLWKCVQMNILICFPVLSANLLLC